MRNVIYFAHPVGGDVDANIARAKRWLRWLRRHEPDHAIVAPWLASILAAGEDDNDPAQRERGLLDAEAVCACVDGIVLCGGRVSTGMQREMDAVIASGGYVVDLTSLGEEPPEGPPMSKDFYGEPEPISPINLGRQRWEES